MNRVATNSKLSDKLLIIVVGQIRCLPQSAVFLKRLADRSRLIFYTDSEGLETLSREASWASEVVDTTDYPEFQSMMSKVPAGPCKSKLYQWARLHIALKEVEVLQSKGEISNETVILKVRTDVGLKGLNLNTIKNLKPSEIAMKTDWIYGFHISDLGTMMKLSTEALSWVGHRTFRPLAVTSLPKLQFGAVRINWMPFAFPRNLLYSTVFSSQHLMSKFGRVGEWVHRFFVMATLKYIRFSDGRRVGKEGDALQISPARSVLATNCLASEMVFTHHVLSNFTVVKRLFPVGLGALNPNRRKTTSK